MEKYYPAGVTGQDKPSKALNAINLMTLDNTLVDLLPRCSVTGQEKCELTQIFSQVFSNN
jgi:putative ATP-dependent endonuclease of OLD family